MNVSEEWVIEISRKIMQQVIDKTFIPIIGLPCWGLYYDRLLNLSINFGKPSLKIREPFKTRSKSFAVPQWAKRRTVTVRGQWWLWIYCCYWKLTSESTLLATGSSSLKQIQKSLLLLEGEKLTSVEMNPLTGATKFDFDLGCSLECRRFGKDSQEDELWTLYKPNSEVLSAYGDGRVTLEPTRRKKSEVKEPSKVQSHARRGLE